jgi:hypothetical protein
MSNNKSYSTNRFLSKTNPQFIRGLADSGSVLDSPEINKLAAQMVDLGIWGNLVFWAHPGLLKERVSGSDVFVTKTYDITANNVDLLNSTNSEQPKLTNKLLDFYTNTLSLKSTNNAVNTQYGTICAWAYFTNVAGSRCVYSKFNDNGETFGIIYQLSSQKILFTIRLTATPTTQRQITSNTIVQANTWYFIAASYDGTTQRLYINGIEETSNSISGTINTASYNGISIGRNFANSIGLIGNIGEERYFNTALTATEIDAIFQATRGKYGI